MSAIEIQSKKYSIIELLLQTNNEGLLASIQEALQVDINKTDFYDELSATEKEQIAIAKQQIKEGKTLSHQAVTAEFRKRYKS